MERKRDPEEGTTKNTPVLDHRWPFPVVLIFLFTSILIPAIAVLAMYAPILAVGTSYGPDTHTLEYSLGTVILAVSSIILVICFFVALIYSSLSPVAVIQIGVITTILWGAEIGVSSVFWDKNQVEICAGQGQEAWQCDYAWLTPLCSSIAAAASLILTLLSWHSLANIVGLRNNSKLGQDPTSVLPLGPPATPPVNLADNRRGPDMVTQEIDPPARSVGFSPRPKSTTAGGEVKLILPARLDPTSSGFVPGRLFYASLGPDTRVGEKKGKGKWKGKGKGKEIVTTPVDSHMHIELPNGIGAGFLLGGNASQGNRIKQHRLTPKVPVWPLELQKALPPAPLPDSIPGSSSYHPSHQALGIPVGEALRPATTTTTTTNNNNNNSSQTNVGPSSSGFPSFMDHKAPAIPLRHPRRISSAPPGSLRLLSSDNWMDYDHQSPRESDFYPSRPILGNGLEDNPQQQHYGGSLGIDANNVITSPKPVQRPVVIIPPSKPRYPIITRKPVPHAPRVSSNLTSPVIFANANAREEQSDRAVMSLSTEESYERRVAGLPPREPCEAHSRPASTASSPVPSSNTISFPKSSSSEATATMRDSNPEEPTPGPVKRDTFSSEESDETLDPEKIALIEEQLAQKLLEEKMANQQQQQQQQQPMSEVPQAQSLTLPIWNVVQTSPTPVLNKKKHPVLDLSRTINSGVSEPRRLSEPPIQSHLSNGPLYSTTEQDMVQSMDNNHSRQDRYTTVSPLQITKALPPFPPPPSQQTTTGSPHSSTPQPPTPTTPRTPRTPISDRSKCVGHFTVTPTGEVEMSPGSYRPRVESISSSKPEVAAGLSNSNSSAHYQGEDLETRHERQGSIKPQDKPPIVGRKRSRSSPTSYVHFELSKNKVY